MNKFTTFIQSLQQLQRTPLAPNPARFNDSLATRIDWNPLKGGGSNFQTKKLHIGTMGTMYYRPTKFAYFFYWIFIGIGLAVGAVGLYTFFIHGEPFGGAGRIFILHPLAFIGVGGYMLRRAIKGNYIFDRNMRMLYLGKKPQNDFLGGGTTNTKQETILFHDIHAFQIIAERVSSKNGSYLSYELNLILNSGKRENLVDHGKIEVIRQDAKRLTQYISVPIRDATQTEESL